MKINWNEIFSEETFNKVTGTALAIVAVSFATLMIAISIKALFSVLTVTVN